MVAQVVEGHVRVKSEWAARPNSEAFLGRVKIAEVDIEVLALHRPAVAERVFGATAHRPSADVIRGREPGYCLSAEDSSRMVDLCPGSAAGDIYHRLVPDGPAEPAACRHQPTLLQFDDAVRVNIEEAGGGAGDQPLARLRDSHAPRRSARSELGAQLGTLKNGDKTGTTSVAR